MRKSVALDALFPRIRQNILAVTLLTPERWWYLSDLAQHLGLTPSSLQRELFALTKAGILDRRYEGNRVYYRAAPDCPFLGDLQGLLTKTIGLADVLKEALTGSFDAVDFAFVYGSIARSEQTSRSDVDLMLIGAVRLSELSKPLREAERHLQCPVNPSLYTMDEFVGKLVAKNHFLFNVMQSEKLFLKGDERELAEVIGRKKSESTYDEHSRD